MTHDPRPQVPGKKERAPNGAQTVGRMPLLPSTEDVALDEDMRRCQVGLCSVQDLPGFALDIDRDIQRRLHRRCHMEQGYRSFMARFRETTRPTAVVIIRGD
jgi:hypothetical protein